MGDISSTDLDEYVNSYIAALEQSGAGRWKYLAQPGRRYLKLVAEDIFSGSLHVHAFIVRASGDVVKSASWKAPQRNADGTLAVRWRLADTESRRELLALVAGSPESFAGGYLYQR